MRPTESIEKRIKNVNIVIDSESNKRVFSNILQAFEKSTAKDLAPADQPNIWGMIFRNPLTKVAAAAVIIVAISFFVFHKEPLEQQRSQKVIVTKSPAEMLTLRSLKIAYRNGGIEAVETQCEKAIEKLGLKPERISVQELLEDIIGT